MAAGVGTRTLRVKKSRRDIKQTNQTLYVYHAPRYFHLLNMTYSGPSRDLNSDPGIVNLTILRGNPRVRNNYEFTLSAT